MFIARYKHIVPRGRKMVSRLVAITTALSFIAMLMPIAGASRDKSNTMACCVGKTAGHCDSGLTPNEPPQPKSEPMCGLESAQSEDDGITIVAEPSQHESHNVSESSSSYPAAKPLSISQPCQMDCGACAVGSTRQQKRERGIVPATSYQNPSLTTHLRFDNVPSSFSSNEDWEQTSPRGPPADLR